MKLKRPFAFTLIELLVVISIIGILAALALPAITSALTKGQMTQTLSNMKQLHLATTQMALDGTTTGDTNLCWPGDINMSWNTYCTNLVPSYIATNDLSKLLSAPGSIVPPGVGGTFPPAKSAILIYGVSENDSGTVVFLTTHNFTNNASPQALSKSAKPYGDKGFVVFRKGGDGAILLPRQYNQTNIIGEVATNGVISGNPQP